MIRWAIRYSGKDGRLETDAVVVDDVVVVGDVVVVVVVTGAAVVVVGAGSFDVVQEATTSAAAISSEVRDFMAGILSNWVPAAVRSPIVVLDAFHPRRPVDGPEASAYVGETFR